MSVAGNSRAAEFLVYRPGSGLSGPTVFEDWVALYARLQILRLANNGGGCYTIDTGDSPATIPAGTYDMTNVSLRA